MTDLDEFPVQGYPDDWCFYHGCSHTRLFEWGDLCQGAADLDFDQRYLLFLEAHRKGEQDDQDNRARRWGWLKRAAVCWWRHGTRTAGEGTYLSRSCWACSGGD